MSVVWRIIDATKADPSLYDLQAPYLNSVAGTSLDGKGVESTVNILHPFTTFDDNAKYYEDKASTVYYANVWTAIIKDFEAHDIIPAGKITPDDVVWGGPIWHQLVDYRAKTDRLLDQAKGTSPTGDKAAMLAKAKAVLRQLRLPGCVSPGPRRDELTADGRAGDGCGRRCRAAGGAVEPAPRLPEGAAGGARSVADRRRGRLPGWLAAADLAPAVDHPADPAGRRRAPVHRLPVGTVAGLLRAERGQSLWQSALHGAERRHRRAGGCRDRDPVRPLLRPLLRWSAPSSIRS